MKDETIARMEQDTYSGPLCRMEQAEPLIPLRHPSGEALLSALSDGRPVTLCPRESPAEISQGSVAVADLNGARLNAAHFALSVEARRQSSVLGCCGLCLAEGRLFSAEGLSAPLLLWPVRLEQTAGGWQLFWGGEGQFLNRPALNRLAEA
ncbi:MAG: hypothetical protein IJ792_04650, partial [Oscillospiraceae bacterium]|nr:hypothetical protein [Oscillospiraceae bacterium]